MLKKDSDCIYILALGGTIASVASNQVSEFYNGPDQSIEHLISFLPIENQSINIKHEQFLQKKSNDITYNDLINIAKKIKNILNKSHVKGIIVVQGTNCIEEVAYFISLVINTKKNIVFTGAFRPMNVLGSDGLRNLYNAILLANDKKMQGLGVILTFNDCFVSARDAYKFNPSLLGDFVTKDGGRMGIIQGNTILLEKKIYYKHTYLSEFNIDRIEDLKKIYIIFGHLGLEQEFIQLAIKNKVLGIVVAGIGKGYLPHIANQALVKASELGVTVVRCSRTGLGMINFEPGYDDKYGFIAGNTLSPHKAAILLSVVLSATNDKLVIQRVFNEY